MTGQPVKVLPELMHAISADFLSKSVPNFGRRIHALIIKDDIEKLCTDLDLLMRLHS
jgi:hypothetical protein